MLKILRYKLGKLYRQIRLIVFQKKNRIFSSDVCLKSLHGEGIEVQEGTIVDHTSSVGAYSYIGRNCAITKSTIGRYCSIANNVSIGQGEHDLTQISTSSIFYNAPYDLLTSKKCNIGDDVWIGVDAIILRGVSIGIGAVIGANSVVTKDVPPFAIVVGSPAKIIRYRFSTEIADRILQSKWWKETPEKAQNIFRELNLK